MKTQNITLDFKKRALVELNDTQLQDVNGGTSKVCLLTASYIFSVVAIQSALQTINPKP